MSPLALLVAAAVTAGPSIDVVVTRSVGADEDRELDVAVRQADLLTLQGLRGVNAPAATLDKLVAKGINDPTTCAARRPCVARLGKLLESSIIVSVDYASVGDRVAFASEAIAVKDGRRLAYHQALLPAAAFPGGFVPHMTQFAEKLAKAIDADPELSAEQAAPVKDAPVATTLVPDPTKDQPAIVAPVDESMSTRRALAWTATGTAIAAGGAGAILAVMGMGAKGQLDAAVYQGPNGPASTLKRAEAEQLSANANNQLTAALACAVTGAVAAGIGAWLFAE